MIESSQKRIQIVHRMLAEKNRRIRISDRILIQELGWRREFPIPLSSCDGLNCCKCQKCRYEEIIEIVHRDENCIWVADEISAMHLILDGNKLVTNPEILKERERFINDPENKEKYPFWYKIHTRDWNMQSLFIYLITNRKWKENHYKKSDFYWFLK